jgi:predicted ABC-type ATPase
MRVFAGPNGSGKSTVINSVRSYKTEAGKIDFGIYVNADDINKDLRQGKFTFTQYKIKTTPIEFEQIALTSGLINKKFPLKVFKTCYVIKKHKILLKKEKYVEQLAQIIADFLRKKLLDANQKFSFETVFSHESKLDIMKQARDKGYKVYLYFVSTNSPEINKERVALRVKKGGHYVPPDKIVSRYYRSLNHLFEAAQISYQTFFFDNSKDKPNMFTNFKIVNGKKNWAKIDEKEAPDWFIKYYANKVKGQKSK